ncbi:hypothetical protein IGI04_035686 [Brassica rapa subsp. trilocularis]|uniref:Uncharacterized protein n=1 Tax=Brassica rapa subsp. trilocularis TaxID=1813537 RepID=A0ABQ7LG31_BRACM|nr:hypothetical protein IGI04_035686 [Brassica rapa subsp. trilocularis]
MDFGYWDLRCRIGVPVCDLRYLVVEATGKSTTLAFQKPVGDTCTHQVRVLHLRELFSWVRLDSGPLHPGRFYLGWEQGPNPVPHLVTRMGSSPPPGVESLPSELPHPVGSSLYPFKLF